MIIGLTGSIGSGKTTIAKLFGKHGFDVIDADEIGHKLLSNNSIVSKKIIRSFGNSILDKSKNIDRKKLGNAVFNDDVKLKKLNSIIHPVIFDEIRSQIRQIQKKCGGKTRIVIDAPLLLETSAKKFVDKIVVAKTGISKIAVRNKKFTKNQIETILKRQMPLDEKLKQADFVIDNNKNLKYSEKQVRNIMDKLKQKNKKPINGWALTKNTFKK